MVKTVGSRELKNRLGTYLSQVREGTRIIVTDRGRPVAELRAFRPDATGEESGLLELAARGLVTPRSREELAHRSKRVRVAGKPVSQTILGDREDRF